MSRAPAVIVLTLALGVLATAGYLLRDLARWPVHSVRVAGDFQHLSRTALERAIARHLGSGFFGIDLSAVRSAALALPWVKDVSIRRVWPDSLHVAVIERRAVARWDGGGLVDADGQLFHPQQEPQGLELPVLHGPPGAEGEMLRRYRELSEALAPAHARIDELSRDARGAWRVHLARGTELVLGREPSLVRLNEFARVLATALRARSAQIDRVDLRYASGFAVHWKGGSTLDAEG